MVGPTIELLLASDIILVLFTNTRRRQRLPVRICHRIATLSTGMQIENLVFFLINSFKLKVL